jgi:hypothetical protein
MNLHSTVYGSRENPQSFKVIFENDKLILKNKLNIDTYWPISIFNDVLKAKSDQILLVLYLPKQKARKRAQTKNFII